MHTSITYLSQLFTPDERLYTCGPVTIGRGPANPRLWHFYTPKLESDHCYFCINPIHPTINLNKRADGTLGSKRHALNVTAFRNFVFECDGLPLEQQRAAIEKINEIVPIKLAIFSGGKSIHLIVSLVDGLNLKPHEKASLTAYKVYWTRLAKTIDGVYKQLYPDFIGVVKSGLYFLDPATSDPARLSRIPLALRNQKIEQSVLFEGPYATSEFVQNLAPTITEMPHASPAPHDLGMGVAEFERQLRKISLLKLKVFFEAPETWVSPEGLYGILFKHTMWAIDATGVPYETLKTYLQKKVYPAIVNSGYPRDPDRAIRDAYVKKGLL